MDKFTTLTGVAAPLPMINVDTDAIIPKQFLKTIKRTGLGKHLFHELRFALCGQHEQRGPVGAPNWNRRGLVLGDDDVSVRATRAEAGHARDPRQRPEFAVDLQRRPPPRLQALLHPQRKAVEVDVRVEGAGMQARHQFPVPHLQQHLRDAGDAGRAAQTLAGGRALPGAA